MFLDDKYLIAIVGPTAVGKTELAIQVAEYLSCEIISCDSRQFYKELTIGTAKPTLEELKRVPHHFIDNLNIDQDYNVMQYEKEALEKINRLHAENKFVVMVGGSGLFYKAVCEGFDEIPDIDVRYRDELIQELDTGGIEKLQEELKERDFELYQQMDIQNTQRLIRALEVCRATGKPFSSFRKGVKKKRPFKIIKIGLDMEREVLYKRIDDRMDVMLNLGLLDEVKSLQEYKDKNALQTVGYKEIFDFLEDKYDWGECVRLLKRNSRRYAKRQLTWFRKDNEIEWYQIDNQKLTLQSILKQIESHSTLTNQD